MRNFKPFESKATTLEWYRPKLKNSIILPSLIYSVLEYLENPEQIIQKISNQFLGKAIIVRSSSASEDSLNESKAGMYKTVLDIPADNIPAIRSAIDQVISSFESTEGTQDCFFVQPMIENCSTSGVVFTNEINSGSPYYCINYDDQSGKTDTITSGYGESNRTLYVLHGGEGFLFSQRFINLVEAIKEVQAVTKGVEALDIEFGINGKNQVFIFQVRPLILGKRQNESLNQDIFLKVSETIQAVKADFSPSQNKKILGSSSFFSNMSDWNPAEMIGPSPKPLAASIYKEIITDSIWAEARSEMGYRNLSGVPLMKLLAGKCYIDVRNSFNSFIPEKLQEDIATKLINIWLEKLKDEPWLHDKVEFEVATTCLPLDFDESLKDKYLQNGLSLHEIEIWKKHLFEITAQAIHSSTIENQEKKIASLLKKRNGMISYQKVKSFPESITLLRQLLCDCKDYGTKPFSVLARTAFIAEELLKSLVRLNIFSLSRAEELKKKTKTVLTHFIESAEKLKNREISVDEFNNDFGHLRPGTYDLLSPRYDSFISDLLSSGMANRAEKAIEETFSLSEKEKMLIENKLKQISLSLAAPDLIKFIQSAIALREYGKLVFTKNLSDSLALIEGMSASLDIAKEDLTYLDISTILSSEKLDSKSDIRSLFTKEIDKAKASYEVTKALKFPSTIFRTEDFKVCPLMPSQPNFITHKIIEGEVLRVKVGSEEDLDLKDKIVLIESADPGYDWIFLHAIRGLVTKYGGVNSHMAIRCAEMGIPAIVGAGEVLFAELESARRVHYDCEAHTVRIL